MKNKSFVILVIAIVGMILASSIAIASENAQYREVISREKVGETLYGDEVWKITWSDGTESTEITTPLMTRILRSLRLQTVFGESSSVTETYLWSVGTELNIGQYKMVYAPRNLIRYDSDGTGDWVQWTENFDTFDVYKDSILINDASGNFNLWVCFCSESGRQTAPAYPNQVDENQGFTCDGGMLVVRVKAISQYHYGYDLGDGWSLWGTDQIKVEVTYPGATGNISVTSDPTGAEVYINDNYITTTPDTITSVPVGTYTIKMVKAGYQNWTESVTVAQDETVPISATLTSEITPPPDVRPNPIAELIQWLLDWIKGIFSKF